MRREMGMGRDMGLGREMGWEEDGLGAGLFTGWMPFTECAHTDTQQ